MTTGFADTLMPGQLQFLPLQPHEFDSLPAGFEYEHEISEASNTDAFATVDDRDLRSVGGQKVLGPQSANCRQNGNYRVWQKMAKVFFA